MHTIPLPIRFPKATTILNVQCLVYPQKQDAFMKSKETACEHSSAGCLTIS